MTEIDNNLVENAIRLKPDFAEAFYNRGFSRHTEGDLENAEQHEYF